MSYKNVESHNFLGYIPGVTAILKHSPRGILLVSLHAGAQRDGNTLTLVVLH